MRSRCFLLCIMLILSGCHRGEPPAATNDGGESRRERDAGETQREPETTHVDPQFLAAGEKLFRAYCAPCHQRGGQGVEGRVPPLDDSPWVAGSEERLVRIVLNGLHGPIEIQGESYNLEMPAFRVLLKDNDIASLLTFVRQKYGAPSAPIVETTVARVRQVTDERKRYWTVEELLTIP